MLYLFFSDTMKQRDLLRADGLPMMGKDSEAQGIPLMIGQVVRGMKGGDFSHVMMIGSTETGGVQSVMKPKRKKSEKEKNRGVLNADMLIEFGKFICFYKSLTFVIILSTGRKESIRKERGEIGRKERKN